MPPARSSATPASPSRARAPKPCSRNRGERVRRADREGARRHRRHRHHALWRRHLGLARRRHRRRGGAAGRQGAARNILAVAGSILQAKPETLDIRNGIVVDADTGTERLGLDELARVAYFRPDTLPPDSRPNWWRRAITRRAPGPSPSPTASRRAGSRSISDTGFVKLLKHWCVEDCGTVINPQLVDEQIRGGVVQGIGAALFEHCIYDERGQLLNGNMADYLVPMAVRNARYRGRPRGDADRRLRARRQGRGRGRHRRRAGAVMNAINDALRPLGARADRNAVHAGQDPARAAADCS